MIDTLIRKRRYLAVLLALALSAGGAVACDDGGSSSPEDVADGIDGTGDMGVDTGVADTGVEDTGVEDTGIDMVVDDEPPTVVGTEPEDGATDVEPSTTVRVVFSEEMDPTVGTISLSTGEMVGAGDGDWEALGTEFVFDLPDTLPSATELVLTIDTDFTDLAGNALENPVDVTYTTVEAASTTVVASVPEEGATDVAVETASISIEFSRMMDTSQGTLDLSGGAGSLGAMTWTANVLSVPVSGLEPGMAYTITLSDFVAADGTPLDGMPYLGDGALDFTTGADTAAPWVTGTSPVEGQVVDPDTFTTAIVTFNEAMDTSITSAELSGTTTTTVTGTWLADGRTITFDVTGMLDYNISYRLDLTGFTDAAGNALDPAPTVDDGVLDFDGGADMDPPSVVEATPAEGATDVPVTTTLVTVTFDETMDVSVTDVPYDNGTTQGTVTGTWTGTGDEIELDVTGVLLPSSTFSLDLSGMQDFAGNALATPDAYLIDASLDFGTAPPTGDSCQDPLTTAEATMLGTDSWEWQLADAQGTVPNGGGETCDSSGAGGDIVVRYEKTSADVANGGKLLNVAVDGSEFLNLEVVSGACDVSDASAVSESCRNADDKWSNYLDLPAGTYWIYVSDTSTFDDSPESTLTIAEVATTDVPEGENCYQPYTTGSAIYTAPTPTNNFHTWEIPAIDLGAIDMTETEGGAGTMTCDTSHGVDQVIEFTKSDANSTLQIDVTSGSSSSLSVAVLSVCDSKVATGTERIACEATSTSHSLSIGAPAGPVYIWIARSSAYSDFPGATVEVREVFGSAGTDCQNGFSIGTGTFPVINQSGEAIAAPSCMGSSNVEWYRLTAGQDILQVTGNGTAALSIVEASSLNEIDCIDDATTDDAVALVQPGSDYCIAVEMGTDITEFTVSEQSYTGVQESTQTTVGFTGTPPSLTGDRWMSSSTNTLYMVNGSDTIVEVPKAGGAVTEQAFTTSEIGDAGIVYGGDVFSLDDTSTSDSARLYRLYDSAAMSWMAQSWDPMPFFIDQEFRAITTDGTMLYGITDYYDFGGDSSSIYMWDPTDMTAGATLVGVNDLIEDTPGMAMDANWIYFAGEVDFEEGIYRLPRGDLSNRSAAPERIASIDLDFTYAPTFVDDLTDPGFLYVRADDATVHAVVDPDGAAPLHVGPVISLGTTSDHAMTYDLGDQALYLFETETDSAGLIHRFTQ